ncbi:MAG: glutamine-hydrolyzing GMP synthase [Gammaproteobacteria bacterium]|nr:glutamine-hydrolyzing GMP synthase [Gammaproteobacteria bacterium]MYD80083.1 glutamine-hydrolyzing GMP synthase [Gammaproteobacteria bacterium]
MTSHPVSVHEGHDAILVIDFGSQYTQLIARRLREIGVYCEIHPFDHESDLVEEFTPKGIVLSGGPESFRETETPRIHESLLQSELPMLGICYGMQAMVGQLGGTIQLTGKREFGFSKLSVCSENPLLHGLEESFSVWMSHGDHVTQLPERMNISATTPSCSIAAFVSDDGTKFGMQFHPEVTHTQYGLEMLRRFVLDVCECTPTWTPSQIAHELIERTKTEVGTEKVLLALSGGVDSSVLAALLERAIGEQLTCILVDNGLLRENEAEAVERRYHSTNAFSSKLDIVDASSRFLDALEGEEDPEIKRKIIGKTFIDVFEEEASKFQDVTWLAQGTIYPDVVESAATKHGKSHVIKSHHNVGGLPDRLHLKVLEPLRELFKDEVRALGLQLGLPDEIVNRHPFPGPGLAVRMAGPFRSPYVEPLRKADAIFLEELRSSGWYEKVSQAFVVFLPVRSVGVVGDARVYDHVVALRAVTTVDFMTADWADLPHELIGKIANRIVNEVEGISRVLYDVTSKPPATIEWE